MMHSNLYEVTSPKGQICTVRAMSAVNAVAGLTGAPRHNWVKKEDHLEVTARKGDGTNLDTFTVRLSCFENCRPIGNPNAWLECYN